MVLGGTALESFPNIALPGDMSQELAQPAHFEQASELLSEDEMAEIVACGPDPRAEPRDDRSF
jgi:coenzyme F420-dependent glucose-6-phosphate dehydrogenase